MQVIDNARSFFATSGPKPLAFHRIVPFLDPNLARVKFHRPRGSRENPAREFYQRLFSGRLSFDAQSNPERHHRALEAHNRCLATEPGVMSSSFAFYSLANEVRANKASKRKAHGDDANGKRPQVH
jgi:hypothetical protein